MLYKLGLLDSFELSQVLLRFARREPHEEDFRLFRYLTASEGVFVDVGANIGQSALSFRLVQPNYKIHSFEVNPAHNSKLRVVARVLRRNFWFHSVGLGSAPATAPFYLPRVRGFPFSQEATEDPEILRHEVTLARFEEVTGTRDIELEQFTISVVRFDDAFKCIEPDIVKIDVQGLELEVLRGMEQMLKASRPILMVEADYPETYGAISEFLQSLGYQGAYKFEGQCLVPSEAAGVEGNVFWIHPVRPRLPAYRIASLP